ncbi:hypothetical protein BVRB_6g141860 [Beta vulgaris subsp. vulgaris]|nr:hypothetical protein BVRB_6g141860 [Beta vulgaris subsp. vulgaris]
MSVTLEYFKSHKAKKTDVSSFESMRSNHLGTRCNSLMCYFHLQ